VAIPEQLNGVKFLENNVGNVPNAITLSFGNVNQIHCCVKNLGF
jgi:hypothetical protein